MSSRNGHTTPCKQIRCAIYTRKSSEEFATPPLKLQRRSARHRTPDGHTERLNATAALLPATRTPSQPIGLLDQS